MKKRLVTSALPYVNNIPHLGNLIQVLSADVFARFCRSKGYETMYVCGTDEYGTATETRALEEGITPKELCDRYHAIHKDIYQWFNINFNHFGRTSTPMQTEITQSIFKDLDDAGFIVERTIEQLYCTKCTMYLADRFVRGTCPKCGYDDARGDQCESCGKLLDPTELVEPRCGTCNNTPEVRKTNHLYLDLPGILPKLEAWIKETSVRGSWAKNAIQMTQAWIRDGLKERCITRDLKWGIPVPKEGYEDKVFYVWFDAPIGYISITANLTDTWQDWWQNPEEVELFQFIGKDNIPFHTVIFPSSLIGSGKNWTKLFHMSSSEYLNYEGGKFSKSKGIGVFGTDARDTGIEADVWRFYIFYNRPEKSDAVFTWKDFQEKTNGELIGNLANLVNRTFTFVNKNFGGKLPEGELDASIVEEMKRITAEVTNHFEGAELRDAFRKIFELTSVGNKAFQDAEPWKYVKTDPSKVAGLLKTLVYLIKDTAILAQPYIPATAEKIGSFIGVTDLDWEHLGNFEGIEEVQKPEILFKKLEDKEVEELREKFSGSQAERAEAENAAKAEAEKSLEDKFRETIDLRCVKITAIERHPEAEKLYVETVDLGEGEEPRQIVSGLVPYYTEEELLNKHVILAYNLKPAKLRGVKSQGMLLAAEEGDTVEVIFLPDAQPGDKIVLKGDEDKEQPQKKRININKFFDIPLKVKEKTVFVGETELVCGGKTVVTDKVQNGEVG